jgi:hypothetical protein
MKPFKRIVIGPAEDPLMIRWVLIRFEAWGVYLHKFLRSDYERATHDHPWPFISIILRGGYFEVHDQTTDRSEIEEYRKPGSVLLRPAAWRHRVVLNGKPSWSLILVGRRCQRWGFFPAGQWCWWRKFDSDKNICGDEILWKGGKD